MRWKMPRTNSSILRNMKVCRHKWMKKWKEESLNLRMKTISNERPCLLLKQSNERFIKKFLQRKIGFSRITENSSTRQVHWMSFKNQWQLLPDLKQRLQFQRDQQQLITIQLSLHLCQKMLKGSRIKEINLHFQITIHFTQQENESIFTM